jgi:hypothetical protein
MKSGLMQSRPLSDTNPELFLLESPGIREYRIENWRLSRVGNGNVIDGAYNFDWQDISILVVFLYLEVSRLIRRRVSMIICTDSRHLFGILCVRSAGGVPHVAQVYPSVIWYGHGAVCHYDDFIVMHRVCGHPSTTRFPTRIASWTASITPLHNATFHPSYDY